MDSLNQGKKFLYHQSKVKAGTNKRSGIKEGFQGSLAKEMQQQQVANQLNQSDLSQLEQLQTQFNSLLDQYNAIQSTETSNAKNFIARVGPSNKFRNTNIMTTDGTYGYVNNVGNVKWFGDEESYANTAGQNGCPVAGKEGKMNFAFTSDYSTPGSSLPTNPSLGVSSYMISGQACGEEGRNVVVAENIAPRRIVTTDFVGCYKDASNAPAMTLADNGSTNYTFAKCMQKAKETGNKYFGIQNYNSATNTGQCAISNDLTAVQQYGTANYGTVTTVWSSQTGGNQGAFMTVSNDGRILVLSATNDVLYASNDPDPNCVNGGGLSNIVGTYGANCNSSGAHVTSGNVTSQLNALFQNNGNNLSQFQFNVSSENFGDPAPNCSKNFNSSYSCGAKTKSKNLKNAEGSPVIFDCTTQINNCQFFLIIQTDGNLCLYRGTVSSNKGIIWSADTNTKQQQQNPAWTANQGKTGQNYLTTTQSLFSGEWIGSDDGSMQLLMQSDGNLVLNVYSASSGCATQTQAGTYLGGQSENAVYELSTTGNTGNIRKIGYVDQDSNLREYPSSMVTHSTKYVSIPGFDSWGNDLPNMPLTNSDVDSCKVACNGTDDCYGFMFDSNTSNCYLKTSGMYPTGERQQLNTGTLYIRQPQLTNDDTCSKEILPIDSIKWDAYNAGSPMDASTKCANFNINPQNTQDLDNIKSQLIQVAQQIDDKITGLIQTSTTNNTQLSQNTQALKDQLRMYKGIRNELKKTKNGDPNADITNINPSNPNYVEGMSTMRDINGMLSDSDLYVLSQNYQYMLWSILAVGVTILALVKK